MCLISDVESFRKLEFWISEGKFAGLDCNENIILVGTKSDLVDKRQVSFTNITNFCRKKGFKYFEVSAKSNQNVEELFQHVIDVAVKLS